ncbi:hypothetical protein HPK19_08350 [Arthrobacter citreus]|nr:hypothetical protein HPK19_08350 [Arthrobacter citreus]
MMRKLAEGVFQVVLNLPNSMELKRTFYNHLILTAQEKVYIYSKKHNWQTYLDRPLITSLKIFASKKEFDYALVEAFNLSENTKVPSSIVAVFLKDRLFMVSPEVYQAVYPEGCEEDSYEKLMIHELAHNLHIRILDGEEEKMGPKWFYEGFAVYVANQFAHAKKKLSKEELLSIVTLNKEVDYRCYKEVLEKVLQSFHLSDLVYCAWKPDFIHLITSALKNDIHDQNSRL